MISTYSELSALMEKASSAPAVALDTEFVWERTFYPALGLIQMAIGHECYLIDPVAIRDLSPLGDLIANPGVCKIIHDAQQDLTILKTATGAFPRNIFDTRLGFGFCSNSSSLSLVALLNELLNIELPKTETRANWLQRPLSEKMMEYACDDVKYLTDAMMLTFERAERQNTAGYLREEMQIYDSQELYMEIPPEEYYQKIKGGRLKRHQLSVLKELATWRELQARQLNRPRGHVVHNNVLMDLVYKSPHTMQELGAILSSRAASKYGTAILEAIKKGLDTPVDDQPVPPRTMNRHNLTEFILEQIQLKAERINIDPALLCSKNELNNLLNSKDKLESREHRLFKGWRADFMRELYAQDSRIAAVMGI
ncbi:MAG: HRDC domain-containing protein [Victivallales bacterium]|nr:HRDC domain-containing protein [Victivallales bacterium]